MYTEEQPFPHSTRAFSPVVFLQPAAMFLVCLCVVVCLLQIKEREEIKGPEMALFAVGSA